MTRPAEHLNIEELEKYIKKLNDYIEALKANGQDVDELSVGLNILKEEKKLKEGN